MSSAMESALRDGLPNSSPSGTAQAGADMSIGSHRLLHGYHLRSMRTLKVNSHSAPKSS